MMTSEECETIDVEGSQFKVNSETLVPSPTQRPHPAPVQQPDARPAAAFTPISGPVTVTKGVPFCNGVTPATSHVTTSFTAAATPPPPPRKRGRPKGSTNKNKRSKSAAGGLNIWDPKYTPPSLQPRLSTLELLALSIQQQQQQKQQPILPATTPLPGGIQLLGPVSQTDVQVLLMLQEQEQQRQQRAAALERAQRELQAQLRAETEQKQMAQQAAIQREINRIAGVLSEHFQQQQAAGGEDSVDKQILQLLQQAHGIPAVPCTATSQLPATSVPMSVPVTLPPVTLPTVTLPAPVPADPATITASTPEAAQDPPIAASSPSPGIPSSSPPVPQTTMSDLEALVSSLRVPEVLNTSVDSSGVLVGGGSGGVGGKGNILPRPRGRSTGSANQGEGDGINKKNRGRPRKYPEHMYQVVNGKVKYPGARERKLYFPNEEGSVPSQVAPKDPNSSSPSSSKAVTTADATAPRKRGRPKGSKNKTFVTSPQQLLDMQAAPVWNGIPEFRQSQQLAAALTGLNYKLLRQSFPV